MRPLPKHVVRRGEIGVSAAFTLIELLVVIAIISLLMAILLPSLREARERSRQVVCLSDQHQLALAGIMYSGDCGRYPQQAYCSDKSYPWHMKRWVFDALNTYAGTSDRNPTTVTKSEQNLWTCPTLLSQFPDYNIGIGNPFCGGTPIVMSSAYILSYVWVAEGRDMGWGSVPANTYPYSASVVGVKPAEEVIIADQVSFNPADTFWGICHGRYCWTGTQSVGQPIIRAQGKVYGDGHGAIIHPGQERLPAVLVGRIGGNGVFFHYSSPWDITWWW